MFEPPDTRALARDPSEDPEGRYDMKLTINGVEHALDLPPDMPLLWVLRDHLDLTGTKYGCGIGQCGACTVHLDGAAVRSCSVRLEEAAGHSVTTIEGTGGRVAEAVRNAWADAGVVQCGYCQPGQVMSAIALLRDTTAPSRRQTENAMNGILCRCGTYLRVLDAIRRASEQL